MTKKALYLAGGGARGAYQAGVLKAISTILDVKKIPFDMISGVSIGSINGAVLAENALDFPAATEKIETLWTSITSQQIFNASNYELSKSVLRNLSNMLIKQSQAGYLLDAAPLRHFISENIDFDRVEANIQDGHLDTIEVISNCYETHQTVSFYQHASPDFEDWNYPRHVSQRVNLRMEHILGSTALPLFFPPAKIDGYHFGDGGMGLTAPLRGTIRAKVDKIMILGTRQTPTFGDYERLRNGDIGFANILGGIMNGLFLDNLDRDIEMVNRMNDIARLLSMWKKRRSPWRPIQTMHLRPSRDIAAIAQAQYHSMPALLRFLLNVLGAKSRSGDLLSFLLFEQGFTTELIKLGFEDTIVAQDDVLQFFED
ncbi:patatin-like phospholipase family protein [Legionella sp. CNM-4043-24]|uniref:patatin-like phospholipase family protein n=1 Tax=Legionella sp. CNM-4043-24 TaxID=3421646 RepID=UPI00403ADD74